MKGIPMGGMQLANPMIADLLLADSEYKYMDKMVNTKQNNNNYDRNIIIAVKTK